MAISSYQSADGHLDSSVFSGQDLALVKSGQWLPELSHFVPINNPHDIDVNLDHARDDGEKIDLLLTTALNPHTDTLRCLGEFIQSRDLTILAATLRAFASIGEMLKDSSLDPEYRHHLEHLRWVLTENLDLTDEDNPSVQLFKRLCQEAESGSSDLIRWAAAYALQQLNYPAGLRRQLLSKPPAEIATDIVPKYGGKLSGQENPLGDREYLKFWVYGATEGLFNGGNGTYYLEAVREVLSKLGMRGIRLALQYGNKASLVEAINFAGGIFGNNLYKDEATRQSLVDRLLPFLNRNDDLEVRNLAAEKLNDQGRQYQVSDRFLKQSDQIRVAVMDADWRRVIALGEAAVPLLCEVVEGSLRLRDSASNIDFQIKALETIDKILTEPNQKVTCLLPYLHGNTNTDKVIIKSANLLQSLQNHLDDKSNYILAALLLKLELPSTDNLYSLSQLDIEKQLRDIRIYERGVLDIYTKAQNNCDKDNLSSLIDKKKAVSMSSIEIYSSYLKERIIQLNIRKLKEEIEEIDSYQTKLYKTWTKISDYLNFIKGFVSDKYDKYEIEYQKTIFCFMSDMVKILFYSTIVLPISLLIAASVCLFWGWLLLVLTGVSSWDSLTNLATIFFYLSWVFVAIVIIISRIKLVDLKFKKNKLLLKSRDIHDETDRLEENKRELISSRKETIDGIYAIADLDVTYTFFQT